jgi:hypothetical protein
MNLRWPGARLGLLLGCLGFAAALRCEAQGNLVPNHSFEEYDTCLAVLGFYTPNEGPLHWFSASGSPDYYQSCVGNGAANGIPQSFYGYQFPQDGEAHVGMVTYQQQYGLREYAMVELLEAMDPGETYCASFWASAGWNGIKDYPQHYVAASHVGMLFTVQPRPWTIGDPWPAAGNSAHVYHSWIIADTVGWTLVSGSFVADSAYRYLMIGNHFDNATTDTLHFATYPWMPKAYTLIDNVCVSVSPDGCPMATGLMDVAVDEIHLHPNPAAGELYLGGVPVGAQIVIHDATGRLIWEGRGERNAWNLDVSGWPRGGYVLRVMQTRSHRTFKFVLIE